MNLIPESNGFKRVNMKRKLSYIQWLKRFMILIVAIFVFGLVFQIGNYFIGNEKLKSSLYYAKVNGNKLEYMFKGSGDYTIVFDGSIGTTLYQWDELAQDIRDELGVKTFVYNRKGYGFSDIGEYRTPAEQAEDLKILLRKAGVTGKLILVGEEYGSLIMNSFAEKYPDIVSGVVLINPISKELLSSDEFHKEIKKKYYKSKVESIGTYFGLTILMDKLDWDITISEFEDNLSEQVKSEFEIQKDRSSYRRAIESEIKSLYEYTDNFPKDGILEDKPLYIICNNDYGNDLTVLGSNELTTVYSIDSSSNLLSTSNKESVKTGISKVIKECKKIEKLKK